MPYVSQLPTRNVLTSGLPAILHPPLLIPGIRPLANDFGSRQILIFPDFPSQCRSSWEQWKNMAWSSQTTVQFGLYPVQRQLKGSDFEAVDVSSLILDPDSGEIKQATVNQTTAQSQPWLFLLLNNTLWWFTYLCITRHFYHNKLSPLFFYPLFFFIIYCKYKLIE